VQSSAEVHRILAFLSLLNQPIILRGAPNDGRLGVAHVSTKYTI
jgi:hypothetical protein